MSQVKLHSPAARSAAKRRAIVAPVVVLLAASLVSGCAYFKRDHVTVGAVPQDYRTNNPITITEREMVYDLPVASESRGLTTSQEAAIRGFMGPYDNDTGGEVKVIVPNGSANEAAAQRIAGDIVHLLVKHGVAGHRIVTYSYASGEAGVSAPIRISYMRLTAATEKCGRWPDDLAKHAENRNWDNFGCSYQNNMAAQIANPADLLGPRQRGDVDGERRAKVIDDYRTATTPPGTEIQY